MILALALVAGLTDVRKPDVIPLNATNLMTFRPLLITKSGVKVCPDGYAMLQEQKLKGGTVFFELGPRTRLIEEDPTKPVNVICWRED